MGKTNCYIYSGFDKEFIKWKDVTLDHIVPVETLTSQLFTFIEILNNKKLTREELTLRNQLINFLMEKNLIKNAEGEYFATRAFLYRVLDDRDNLYACTAATNSIDKGTQKIIEYLKENPVDTNFLKNYDIHDSLTPGGFIYLPKGSSNMEDAKPLSEGLIEHVDEALYKISLKQVDIQLKHGTAALDETIESSHEEATLDDDRLDLKKVAELNAQNSIKLANSTVNASEAIKKFIAKLEPKDKKEVEEIAELLAISSALAFQLKSGSASILVALTQPKEEIRENLAAEDHPEDSFSSSSSRSSSSSSSSSSSHNFSSVATSTVTILQKDNGGLDEARKSDVRASTNKEGLFFSGAGRRSSLASLSRGSITEAGAEHPANDIEQQSKHSTPAKKIPR